MPTRNAERAAPPQQDLQQGRSPSSPARLPCHFISLRYVLTVATNAKAMITSCLSIMHFASAMKGSDTRGRQVTCRPTLSQAERHALSCCNHLYFYLCLTTARKGLLQGTVVAEQGKHHGTVMPASLIYTSKGCYCANEDNNTRSQTGSQLPSSVGGSTALLNTKTASTV